ncbi:MAG: ABC-F family ATP-binding cassette domain-containing protein [Clostridia bacterium]|nr:ABC-F family ATP-binding cassette domain-containing protein [Clostridia bacterium]
MLVALNQVSKSFGAEQILEEITFQINEGDKIGLLGLNGAGKSTLLNIITGNLPYDSGELYVEKGLEIGYLKQNAALNLRNTIQEELDSVFAEVHEIGRKLESIRAKMAEGDNSPELLREYDRLNLLYEAKDGYSLDVLVNTVMTGMGFASYDRAMNVSLLSGGEKNRLGFVKILLKKPRLLILDEPTNHLDFETLTWLEEYLKEYKGAVLTVSHDRYFLDKIVTSICEIEDKKLIRYKGGYSQFIRQKREREEFLLKEYEKQQEEIAKLKNFVAKNLAKSASVNGVGTRVKALEKMEVMEKPNPVKKKISLAFTYDMEPHKQVFYGNHISVAVGEGNERKELCKEIDFEALRGEKIAIIGRNGIGKSSFVKAILGKISCSGKVKWGENVKIAYFEQENRELNFENTILQEVHDRFPTKKELELRSLLGSLLISGEDVFKKINTLSGGERAKVMFAIMMLERPNVLVLDEPSNHLDYDSKEILDKALCEFKGTLIMISHDRYLLNRVPTKIAEMKETGFVYYDGGYDYYLEHKKEDKPVVVEKTVSENKTNYHRTKQQRAEEVKIRNRIKSLEKEIEELEGKKKGVEEQLSLPEVVSDYQRLNKLCLQIKALDEEIEAKYAEWEALNI